MRYVPPTRRSISATVVVNPAGAHQRLTSAGTVHDLKTFSRDAGMRRVIVRLVASVAGPELMIISSLCAQGARGDSPAESRTARANRVAGSKTGGADRSTPLR